MKRARAVLRRALLGGACGRATANSLGYGAAKLPGAPFHPLASGLAGLSVTDAGMRAYGRKINPLPGQFKSSL